MTEQKCGNGVPTLTLGRDPQSDMISRCIRFQTSLGHYDSRLSDLPPKTFCMPMVALHHLDMARQECAEAYDMLEGGWKNHKRNPTEPDQAEVLMELVDVLTLGFNAYAFMGGSAEAELVAASTNRSDQRIKMLHLGLSEVWTIGRRSYELHGPRLEKMYGYGATSFGSDWVKAVATRVNVLATKVASVAETLRSVIEQDPKGADDGTLIAASGFIYIEIVPWVMGAMQAIPMVGQDMSVAYSHFVRKNEINFERQTRGY